MSELVGPLGYEEEQYKKNYSDATQNVKYFNFQEFKKDVFLTS